MRLKTTTKPLSSKLGVNISAFQSCCVGIQSFTQSLRKSLCSALTPILPGSSKPVRGARSMKQHPILSTICTPSHPSPKHNSLLMHISLCLQTEEWTSPKQPNFSSQFGFGKNPRDGGAWWAAVHGVAESWTQLNDFTFTFLFVHWRRQWQPTPVFLPGESQGRGSLVGCHLWGRTESDTTERLSSSRTPFSMCCA